jgi:peptidoglycan/LPS O-acetylase OafA/YrhL
VIVAIAAASWCVYSFIGDVTSDAPGDPMLTRLIVNSPAPYLWLLLTGILFYRYERQMKNALVGQLGRWLAVFLVFRATLWLIFEAGTDEKMPLAFNGVAQLLALAPAFALGLSPSPLLRRIDQATKVDLSYSVYLWHMVIINAIIHWDLATTWVAAAIVLVGSTVAAKISWHAVEAPALARKRRRPTVAQLAGPAGYSPTG